ncbi:hypothetical protein IWW34DRAFT_804322 [Fusarium oxysporum f. sp. albedinis]|nr:hypothetical protein IWW34DRAFT_804322 [Fusarium oxysporum f. sp. albedinis]
MVQRIAAVVTQCIDCFGKIVRAPTNLAPNSPTFGRDMADQQTRCNVWAGNIGAHRNGLSSLDYRLRDSSQIEDQVLSLLKDLIELMQDAHDILMGNEVPWDKINAGDDEDFDGRDTEFNQISVDIADVVNCLLRLSHVSSKFRTIEPLLAERLGKAISRRRQFFNYRLAHRTKLSQGLTHEGGDAETIASSLPEYLKDVARGGQPLPINAIGDEGSNSGISINVESPPLPKESSEGPFECPFCHTIIVANTRSSWKERALQEAPVDGTRETDSLEAILMPTGRSHGGSVTTRNLDTLVYLSQKPVEIKQGIPCPMCAEMMRSTSQYQRHVGRHQEQLALFALPTVESDDKDERVSESDSSAESIDIISNQDEQGNNNIQPEEPPTSYSMLRTDEMTALPPNDPNTNMTNRQNEYFVRRDGIDREVITADICQYLGQDALVRPGHYENPETGQAIQCYYITASRNLTSAMIEDLKADSAQWEQEVRAVPRIRLGQGRYRDSQITGIANGREGYH